MPALIIILEHCSQIEEQLKNIFWQQYAFLRIISTLTIILDNYIGTRQIEQDFSNKISRFILIHLYP